LNKKNGEGLLGSNNNSGTVHPMLTRSYDVLEPYFCRYVLPGKDDDSDSHDDSAAMGGHGLLATPEAWEELVLDTLPYKAKETVGKNLKKKWSNPREAADLTPVEKWQMLLQHLRVKFGFPSSWPSPSSSNDGRDEPSSNNSKRKKSKSSNFSSSTLDDETRKVFMWPMEIIFKYTYPRLDINVSKMQNHLLKSPFCVHPKTGRVCVPIDPDAMDAHHPSGGFDPFSVPTLSQLARELDEFHKHESEKEADVVEDSSNQHKKNVLQHDWQKTSLKKYFEIFEKSFLEPIEKEWRREERDLAEQHAATRGDF
jgi:DNA primase small subunit